MKYQPTVNITAMAPAEIALLNAGQWVIANGNKGIYLGVTPAQVVVVAYQDRMSPEYLAGLREYVRRAKAEHALACHYEVTPEQRRQLQQAARSWEAAAKAAAASPRAPVSRSPYAFLGKVFGNLCRQGKDKAARFQLGVMAYHFEKNFL